MEFVGRVPAGFGSRRVVQVVASAIVIEVAIPAVGGMLAQWHALHVEHVVVGARVEEEHVMDAAHLARPLGGVVVRIRPLPDHLVAELFSAEQSIQKDLEVVARSGVAVKPDGTRRLEDAAEFDQADGHLDKVRHHLVLADPRA